MQAPAFVAYAVYILPLFLLSIFFPRLFPSSLLTKGWRKAFSQAFFPRFFPRLLCCSTKGFLKERKGKEEEFFPFHFFFLAFPTSTFALGYAHLATT